MDHEESVDRLINADLSVNWDQQLSSDFEEIMTRSEYDVPTMSEQELDNLLSTGVLIDNGEKVFFLLDFCFYFTYCIIGTHCVRHSRIWYSIMNSSFR